VNDRIGQLGDYQTPEQFIPNAIPTKGVRFMPSTRVFNSNWKPMIPRPEDFQMWETCMNHQQHLGL